MSGSGSPDCIPQTGKLCDANHAVTLFESPPALVGQEGTLFYAVIYSRLVR